MTACVWVWLCVARLRNAWWLIKSWRAKVCVCACVCVCVLCVLRGWWCVCLGQVKAGNSSTTLHVWRPGTPRRMERWDAFHPGTGEATTSMPTAEWGPANPATSLLWRAEAPGDNTVQVLEVPGGRYWARVAPFTWREFATLGDAEAAVAGAGTGAGAGAGVGAAVREVV